LTPLFAPTYPNTVRHRSTRRRPAAGDLRLVGHSPTAFCARTPPSRIRAESGSRDGPLPLPFFRAVLALRIPHLPPIPHLCYFALLCIHDRPGYPLDPDVIVFFEGYAGHPYGGLVVLRVQGSCVHLSGRPCTQPPPRLSPEAAEGHPFRSYGHTLRCSSNVRR
jgi:hypothetical protein